MKYLRRMLCALVAASLFGCGGGGGDGPVATAVVPSISNMTITPATALYMQNGGSIPSQISFNCSDAQNDISTAYIVTNYSNGTVYSSSNGAVVCTNGSITLNGTANTTFRDVFTVKILVSDVQGNASNQISATYTVQ